MKAKEYAERFRQEGKTNEAIYKVWKDMFCEFKEIAEQRHAETDAAVTAIYFELVNKWKAFAREFPGEVKPDGFELMIKNQCPDLYTSIVMNKIRSAK